jgi:RNA polymerase sigma factor (TIGR02999 family)
VADGDITQLLNKWLGGDVTAEDDLFRLIHNDLRRKAKSYMGRENPGHTLGPTDLVHQAYLKLRRYHPERWQSRAHFYAVFSNAMRQTLVDHARAKRFKKRGGGVKPISLDEAGDVPDKYYQTLLDLDPLLGLLAHDNPDASNVFQLKYFGGLSSNEIAEATGMSLAKVNRSWKYAELWLQRELKSKNGKQDPAE